MKRTAERIVRNISGFFIRKKRIGKPAVRRGSTIAEMLVTVALMGIVMTAVTTGVRVFMNIYHQITTHSEAMLLVSTLSDSINGELRNAMGLNLSSDFVMEQDDTGQAHYYLDSFQSGLRGYRIRIENGYVRDTRRTDTGRIAAGASLQTEPDHFPAVVFGNVKNGAEQTLLPVPAASYTHKLAAYLVPWEQADASGNGKQIELCEDGCFHYTIRVIYRPENLDAGDYTSGNEKILHEEACIIRPLNPVDQEE